MPRLKKGGSAAQNSRAKGIRGELEIAALLRNRGIPARRSQQHKGTADSADVEDDPEGIGDHEFWNQFHLEVKFYKVWSLHTASHGGKWLGKARSECGSKTPVVLHRSNGSKVWWAMVAPQHTRTYYILPFPEFIKLYQEGHYKNGRVTI